METLEKCPVCGNDQFHPFLECKDYTVSQEVFKIVQCDACEFVFTNPRPAESEIGSYYQSEEYISHSNTGKGFINSLYKIARKFTMSSKYSMVKKYSKGNDLLDYGCGTGAFLSHCKEKGMNVTGLEPDEKARGVGYSDFGVNILPMESVWELKPESFDIITLWHVLEHVHKLDETLAKLRDSLKTGGHIVIAVPNHISYDAKVYGEFWAAYDVPRHLYHFTPTSISQQLEKQGFKLLKTLPQKLDSFYVSMLSEKYKGKSGNLVDAFLNGLRSNVLANSKLHNFSSQIYIATKA